MIAAARLHLASVRFPESIEEKIADHYVEHRAAGRRGDIFFYYGALAYAALDGPEVTQEDLEVWIRCARRILWQYFKIN